MSWDSAFVVCFSAAVCFAPFSLPFNFPGKRVKVLFSSAREKVFFNWRFAWTVTIFFIYFLPPVPPPGTRLEFLRLEKFCRERNEKVMQISNFGIRGTRRKKNSESEQVLSFHSSYREKKWVRFIICFKSWWSLVQGHNLLSCCIIFCCFLYLEEDEFNYFSGH